MSQPPRHARSLKLSEVMLGGYLSFLVQGAAATFYGPALVCISDETGEPVSNLGLLFVLHWSGYFLSTITVNRIARRLEIRRSALLGLLMMVLGAVGLMGLPLPLNLLSALLIGYGAGMLEVLMNRTVEYMAVDGPAAALSRLHATFGVGAVIMPLIIAAVNWFGMNWRVAGAALIAIALLNAAEIVRWPEFTMPHGGEISLAGFPWRSIMVFVLMFVIYVGVETGVGGWATTFFAKLGQGPFLGAIVTSLFFLTFSIGRVFLAHVPERLGYARTIRLFCLLGAAVLLLTFNGELAIVGFALAGISFSIIFPTLLAWAARRHPEIRAQVASVSIASAGVGGIVIPYLFGHGVEGFGAASLPPMLIATTLAVAVLALFESDPKRGLETAGAAIN